MRTEVKIELLYFIWKMYRFISIFIHIIYYIILRHLLGIEGKHNYAVRHGLTFNTKKHFNEMYETSVATIK